jgi:hypothetical protein
MRLLPLTDKSIFSAARWVVSHGRRVMDGIQALLFPFRTLNVVCRERHDNDRCCNRAMAPFALQFTRAREPVLSPMVRETQFQCMYCAKLHECDGELQFHPHHLIPYPNLSYSTPETPTVSPFPRSTHHRHVRSFVSYLFCHSTACALPLTVQGFAPSTHIPLPPLILDSLFLGHLPTVGSAVGASGNPNEKNGR